MNKKLYNLPKYYDVAFSWDITSEIKIFQELFKKYVPFEVKKIMEPACGTGRFLVSFPKYGYNITGYDNSPEMIEYTQKRISDEGLQDMSTVITGDMRSTRFKTKFDAAINSINSLGYLLSDDDILSHLCNTGESLRSEGIYIVHFNCACDKFETGESQIWIMEKDGIRVKTIWAIEKEDWQKKISYQVCRMEINDHNKNIVLEERHILRLWLFEDLKSLIRKSGKFELAAIYDDSHKQIPLDTHICGELGNLYYILKVL